MYTHHFKCPVCGKTFDWDFNSANKPQRPFPPGVPQHCWEWQRETGLVGRARTGCTGFVKWDGHAHKPTLKVAAAPVDPVANLRNLYKNVNYDVVRFSNIPPKYQAAVRSIIGAPNSAAYTGPYDRGVPHQTDPRGVKGGQPPSSGTREYHLTQDQSGRMTRAKYGGVFAFYFSPTHNIAANSYEYCLIVDDTDRPYLRGSPAVQLAQP